MATLATIRTGTWDVLYTYLQTTNPISTNNIYSAKNSQLISSVGYPIVLINPPSVSVERLTVNSQFKEAEIVFNFEIYHTSSANLKALTDEVIAKLWEGQQTFQGQRMMKMMVEGQDYQYWEDQSKTIHMATFAVTFRFVERG
jgi:hypothetical protein